MLLEDVQDLADWRADGAAIPLPGDWVEWMAERNKQIRIGSSLNGLI